MLSYRHYYQAALDFATTANNSYFQDEDVIPDRCVVHEDQYRCIREGLAKAVISGNVQDMIADITVRIVLTGKRCFQIQLNHGQ